MLLKMAQGAFVKWVGRWRSRVRLYPKSCKITFKRNNCWDNSSKTKHIERLVLISVLTMYFGADLVLTRAV